MCPAAQRLRLKRSRLRSPVNNAGIQSQCSKTVTAAWIPEDLDWKPFNADLRKRGLVVAGGQGKLTGRIFRIGHLGSVTVEEIIAAMATLEAALLAAGRDVEPGRGVAAAQRAALEASGVRAAVAAG